MPAVTVVVAGAGGRDGAGGGRWWPGGVVVVVTARPASPGSNGAVGWDALLPQRLPRRCRFYWITEQPCPSTLGSHGCHLDYHGPVHSHGLHPGPNQRHRCSCGQRTEGVPHVEPVVLCPVPESPGRSAAGLARDWLRSRIGRALPRSRTG